MDDIIFKKDTTIHHIGMVGDKLPTDPISLSEIDEILKTLPRDVTNIPEAVQKFTASIRKNFDSTASNLLEMAAKLESKAADMRQRAQKLQSAADDVAIHVEDWVSFERASNDIAKFVFPLVE